MSIFEREFQDAVSLHQTGKLIDAETAYKKLLVKFPDHSGANHYLGLIAHQQGRHDDAVQLIDRAIALQPDDAEAHYNKGVALQSMGRIEDSVTCYEASLKITPGDAKVLYNLSSALYAAGRAEESALWYRRLIKREPRQAELHHNLAAALLAVSTDKRDAKNGTENESLTDALHSVNRALSLNPDYADGQYCKGNILISLGQIEEAIGCFDDAINCAKVEALGQKPAEDSTHILAYLNKGGALEELGRIEEALVVYESLIAVSPDFYGGHANKATILQALGRYEEAMAGYEKAISLNPDRAVLLYNRAILQLLIADYEAGLAGLEYRFGDKSSKYLWREFDLPRWTGEDIEGGLLHIWPEQGVGDHLLYASLLPELENRGVAYRFECDPRLEKLLARSFSAENIIADQGPTGGAPKGASHHIPMASIPVSLGNWPDNGTPSGRFLNPDEKRRAHFSDHLKAIAAGRKLIGVSWRSARKSVGLLKSLPLIEWGPVLKIEGALFVNLQYGNTDQEITAAENAFGVDLHTFADLDRMDDLDGLAALIDSLDLVISTSNVTAHFAGALGKECWLALPKAPLWYWGARQDRELFYTCIRSFRQQTPGDWKPVITAIGEALLSRVG